MEIIQEIDGKPRGITELESGTLDSGVVQTGDSRSVNDENAVHKKAVLRDCVVEGEPFALYGPIPDRFYVVHYSSHR